MPVRDQDHGRITQRPASSPYLDHDRKGVPGSPDLANVILEKIRGSDVFVADVTPVGETLSQPAKKLMNANVAIELGYALHAISDRRLIMIMNSAYLTVATGGGRHFSHTQLHGDLAFRLEVVGP